MPSQLRICLAPMMEMTFRQTEMIGSVVGSRAVYSLTAFLDQ